jgi:small-conductance mechanosensitive channel
MTTLPIPDPPTAGKGPDGHPKPGDTARRSERSDGEPLGMGACHSAIAWLLLAILLALHPVMADEIPAASIQPPATWSQRLDSIDQELTRGVADSARIDMLWEDLVGTRVGALNQSQELESRNKETRRLIAALGPKPAEGEPQESPDVQAQRRLFDQELMNQESLLKQADLALERADDLARTLGAARRSRLSQDLLSPLPYPLQTGTWDRARDQIQNFDSELHRGGKLLQSGWLTLVALGGLVLGFMLAMTISSAATHGMLRRFGQSRGALAPSYRERVRAAIVVAVLRGLFPALLFVGWLTGLWIVLERYRLLSDQTIKPVGIGFGIIF